MDRITVPPPVKLSALNPVLNPVETPARLTKALQLLVFSVIVR